MCSRSSQCIGSLAGAPCPTHHMAPGAACQDWPCTLAPEPHAGTDTLDQVWDCMLTLGPFTESDLTGDCIASMGPWVQHSAPVPVNRIRPCPAASAPACKTGSGPATQPQHQWARSGQDTAPSPGVWHSVAETSDLNHLPVLQSKVLFSF